MRPVTFLLPDLGFSGHAKQLSLLGPALKGAGREVHVFSLGGDGPFGGSLRNAGISIEGRHGRRPWDLSDWFALRRRVNATRGGVLHVFGASALRRLHFATLGLQLPPVVLTLTGREYLGQLDLWLARRMQRILVPHAAAVENLARQGVPNHLLQVVPLAIGEPPPPLDRLGFCQSHGIPPEVPLMVTAGRMESRDDLFGAVWAFEFLRYVKQTVHLLVVGDGPGRAATEESARGLAPEGSRVLFLGMRPDFPRLLGMADFVVAPHLTGGANAALDAMSAGKAVIAARTPDLMDVVEDEVTGLLVPPKFSYEMARAMRRLMDNPEMNRRLGETGQARVRERHGIAMVREALERVFGQ
jgi:glycosyltransferase involved in cell wall biosynthesis